MKSFIRIAVAVFLIEFITGQFADCLAQGNSFTYQGRLNFGGAAANGSYDMAFTLFNTNITGTAVAGPVTNTAVGVTNGLFTTLVNFGPGVFTGASNWLQIAVSTNAANAFSTLTPRQQLTPTPYAIFAGTASNLSGTLPATQLSGTLAAANIGTGTITSVMLAPDAVTMLGTPGSGPTNTVNVSSSGLVGIGLGNQIPTAGLQIANGAPETTLSVLYEVESGSGGFTNLAGPSSMAAANSLVAVGANNGITLVSITNSSMPVPVSQLVNGVGAFTSISEITGLAWAGSNLVAASFGSNAVTIIACTNPASPVKLAELDNGVGGWNYLSGARSVAVSSSLLAIAAAGSSAVTLADISNPKAPVLKSTIVNGVGGFTNLGGVISVAISGNVMAVGAIYSNAVTLVNISNPASPEKLAEIRNGVGGFTNLSEVDSVALNGNLLAISSLGNSAVTLVDVTSPSSPVLLSQIVDGVDGYSITQPFDVTFSGSQLAIGTAYTTVSLVNVSNPGSPMLVAAATLGLNGADYLNEPSAVAITGTNLAVAGSGASSLTIFGMGTQSVGLDSANWVGIGTTQPMAPLDVVGNVIIQNATQFDVSATHVAIGDFATATTTNAISIGYLTTASGMDSLALGDNTTASGTDSTAMGSYTTASGNYSTAMGEDTFAAAPNSTAMGEGSVAGGQASTCMGSGSEAGGAVSIAMGYNTGAHGDYSIAMGANTGANANYAIAMGDNVTAAGTYSFAAGQQAQALHQGAFVWADSQNAAYNSTTNDSFNIRAQGGVHLDNSTSIAFGNQTRQMLELYRDPSSTYIYGIGVQNSTFYQRAGTNGGFAWYMGGTHNDSPNNAGGGKTLMTLSTAGLTVNGTFVSASDRNLKENFKPVSGQDVLQKVATMPVSRWNYINDAGTEHIGPMAQDFYAAFGVGPDDKHITTVDEGGVALAAIQGLNQKLEAENAELKSQNDALAERLSQLETLVKQMAQRK